MVDLQRARWLVAYQKRQLGLHPAEQPPEGTTPSVQGGRALVLDADAAAAAVVAAVVAVEELVMWGQGSCSFQQTTFHCPQASPHFPEVGVYAGKAFPEQDIFWSWTSVLRAIPTSSLGSQGDLWDPAIWSATERESPSHHNGYLHMSATCIRQQPTLLQHQ